jgi:hypothetical protein
MKTAVRPVAAITALVLVVALTLAAMGTLSWRLFWFVAILAAIIAYYVVPSMQKS